ncbi:MAG: hypothetical protein U9N31_01795 [Candidatus Marinimicrobia bacterium]|nr:hypothetical protein [Candidatus Neomarinimicrobiota bacterium]
MMRFAFIFITLIVFGFPQTTFPGLNTWTNGQIVGLAGGGYLFSNHNDFRNAAILSGAKRQFKFDVIKYPAGISGQSIMTNWAIKGHFVGVKVSRINYGLFEGRNMDNHKTGDYSAGDIHLQFGFAEHTEKARLIIGLNGGLFLSQIEKTKAKAVTISPGLIFRSQIANFGLILQNYGKTYDSYGESVERLPTSWVISVARRLKNLPLDLEFDYAYFTETERYVITFSGRLILNNGLIIKGGTSSNKADQMTNVSFIRNVFSDLGIGIAYEVEDIMFDMNTYTYGPGGFIFAMGISVRY